METSLQLQGLVKFGRVHDEFIASCLWRQWRCAWTDDERPQLAGRCMTSQTDKAEDVRVGIPTTRVWVIAGFQGFLVPSISSTIFINTHYNLQVI